MVGVDERKMRLPRPNKESTTGPSAQTTAPSREPLIILTTKVIACAPHFFTKRPDVMNYSRLH
jgi:hypothetical protein